MKDTKLPITWLNEIPNLNKTDHGYKTLLGSIDTVLMGVLTYHEIKQDVHFIIEDIITRISELKAEA